MGGVCFHSALTIFESRRNVSRVFVAWRVVFKTGNFYRERWMKSGAGYSLVLGAAACDNSRVAF
jgi:hypothetical protein